jgi:hypothetical protein
MDNTNCLLAFPDRILPTAYVTPVLAGGSWRTSGDVKLANLQDPDLTTLARSTNADPASTVINIDFGTLRDIRVAAIPRHNISLSGSIRFTYWETANHDAELVPNSGFATDTWWSKSTGCTISGGVGIFTGVIAGNGIYRPALLIPGRSYQITYTITSLPSGSLQCRLYTSGGPHTYGAVRTAPGTYTETLIASGDRFGILAHVNGTSGEIDNVSVEEAPIYDSSLLPVWLPFYPQGSLPWGHPALWDGKISVEDQDGYQFDFIRAFPDNVIARYGRIEINDPDNPAGYIEMARCIQAPAWQTPIGQGMQWGATVKWASEATKTRAPFGPRTVDETGKWREVTCTIRVDSREMAMAIMMEMQRRLGQAGELVFIFDPTADSQAMWQASFLCNMDELDPITFAGFSNTTAGFKLVEI